MPHNRFYLDQDLSSSDTYLLEDTEAHHLLRVMRGKVGDSVELVNGANQLLSGIIVEVQQKNALIQKKELIECPAEPNRLILAQSLVEMARLENIVEKTTELGVDEIWLFPAIFSEKDTLSANQEKRLLHIAISAMKQSGRLTLPKILMKEALTKWKALENTIIYYGDLHSGKTSEALFRKGDRTLFFIGPERGWHDKERSHLKEKLNGEPILFHRNTLRTDTAAIFLTGLLHSGR